MSFSPEAILDVLDRHQVQYVLVGGYAATLHGARRPTTDVDITPEMSRANLDRLAAALKELRARVRVDDVPEGLPFGADATSLAGLRFANLTTPHGDLDLTFSPSGTGGYAELIVSAQRTRVGSVDVDVASLGDIIRSKRAAGRPKDADALPELARLQRARAGRAPGAEALREAARQLPSPSRSVGEGPTPPGLERGLQ